MMNLTVNNETRLALGTVQFGLEYGVANNQGRVSHLDAKAILEHALANGINLLDTAIAYGDSEQRLGEIGVQFWQVVTKLPAIPEDCISVSAWVENSVQDSLRRLRQKCLYGLLLHRPEQLLSKSGQELFDVLSNLKSRGLVEKIGISIYSPDELDVLCHHYKFDLIQTPFNVLDRRMIDSGWLVRLHEMGTEVHVRSVFLQGLLLMPSAKRPLYFARWQSLLSTWDDWLEEHKLTPVQACLQYALSFPEIAKVVVGVDSVEQLQEIITSAKGLLPPLPINFNTDDINLLSPANWRLV